MTRQAHDQLAKQYVAELLTLLGQVETSSDVFSEVRQADIWFVPETSSSANIPNLGLLNIIAAQSCLIEVFRNAPTVIEVRNCKLKLFAKQGEMLRQANNENIRLREEALPFLWILTPTCSPKFLKSCRAEADETNNLPTGFYLMSELDKTAIIVINQLPEISETLHLRVLGRGGTQKKAIKELVNLPERDNLLKNLLEILASWRTNLQIRDNLTNEEKEDIMNLSPAYEKQREEWKLEGKLEGKLEEQRLMVESLIEGRFGKLDQELSAIIDTVIALPRANRTQLLLNLASLSKEELLSQLENN
ncbi:MAG: hypothetical protein DSM107014_06100 [Gomphosphaeria aponina SAG 52.96 = DSM 107014]|uniref:DUF4351 domain-containing protein n=1 Tax=Gomphosphaeria aponina SAG 52.96 = DSM 107014 TaxID=1521640 RepID=A0A941GXD0_9CHRO|nr:hypothetical protein [Gomphosphaeria aponina SAG 52.96 = DSM 107014]